MKAFSTAISSGALPSLQSVHVLRGCGEAAVLRIINPAVGQRLGYTDKFACLVRSEPAHSHT